MYRLVQNFFTKENLIQTILHCQHRNTSSVEILDLNVSCDSIPIRLKNNLMQFRFFCVLLVGKMWNPSIHVSLFTAVCTALYNCVISFFFCQSTDVSVQLEALDILGDLLSRFGGE